MQSKIHPKINHQAREALRDRIGRSLQLTAPRLHSSRLLEVLGSDTRTIQGRLHNGRCPVVWDTVLVLCSTLAMSSDWNHSI